MSEFNSFLIHGGSVLIGIAIGLIAVSMMHKRLKRRP